MFLLPLMEMHIKLCYLEIGTAICANIQPNTQDIQMYRLLQNLSHPREINVSYRYLLFFLRCVPLSL